MNNQVTENFVWPFLFSSLPKHFGISQKARFGNRIECYKLLYCKNPWSTINPICLHIWWNCISFPPPGFVAPMKQWFNQTLYKVIFYQHKHKAPMGAYATKRFLEPYYNGTKVCIVYALATQTTHHNSLTSTKVTSMFALPPGIAFG